MSHRSLAFSSFSRALGTCAVSWCLLSAGPLYAQIKMGSNPATLASDTQLQVEATDGSQVVVRRSAAQLGVGTSNPGNRLDVHSGSSGASGVRITQLPNAGVLATNASGDIVASTLDRCGCQDIKASVRTTNHGDWKLMDGTAYSGPNCGPVPGINAGGLVLVGGGTLAAAGTVSAATPIVLTRSQLPIFNLSATTNAYTHSHWGNGNGDDLVPRSGIGLLRQSVSGENRTTALNDTGGAGWEPDVLQQPWKIPFDTHNHTTATTENINNTGSQSGIALTAAHLPRLHVNYFICVH